MSDDHPETNKATKIFISVAAIILIAFLAFLLWPRDVQPISNTVEYNYFTFYEVGGLWNTKIQLKNQLYEGTFRFNPVQVEDVYIAGNFSNFKPGLIYITFDPNSSSEDFKYLALASAELGLHLVRALNVSIEAACTVNETDACIDRTIVNCGDDKNVIYIKSEAPTQITLGETCVTLSGIEMELLKSVDRVLFQWYKIMR